MDHNLTYEEIFDLQTSVVGNRGKVIKKVESKLKKIHDAELKILQETPVKVNANPFSSQFYTKEYIDREEMNMQNEFNKILAEQCTFQNKFLEHEKLKVVLENINKCEIYKKIRRAQEMFHN